VNALSGHIIKAQKLVGFEIKGHNLVWKHGIFTMFRNNFKWILGIFEGTLLVTIVLSPKNVGFELEAHNLV
jgi:hypothetical protein